MLIYNLTIYNLPFTICVLLCYWIIYNLTSLILGGIWFSSQQAAFRFVGQSKRKENKDILLLWEDMRFVF